MTLTTAQQSYLNYLAAIDNGEYRVSRPIRNQNVAQVRRALVAKGLVVAGGASHNGRVLTDAGRELAVPQAPPAHLVDRDELGCRGTCRCGLEVVRFTAEGRTPASNRRAWLPADGLELGEVHGPATRQAAELAERLPVGARARNVRTGLRFWITGHEIARDGEEIITVDYRDGSAEAAGAAATAVLDPEPAELEVERTDTADPASGDYLGEVDAEFAPSGFHRDGGVPDADAALTFLRTRAVGYNDANALDAVGAELERLRARVAELEAELGQQKANYDNLLSDWCLLDTRVNGTPTSG